MEESKSEFICPECGSTTPAYEAMVSRNLDPDDPWSFVLQTITCGECNTEIPAHLAERWGGISLEDARSQWRDIS